tara:strand:+ start:975 stop:2744 length:1770 start_codon:yes stop_codon:yes gene_type:complete
MILSIYKFKLYYPNGDSEYSGGDEGGAKESDPSSDPGTSTPTGTPTSGYGGSILESNTIAGNIRKTQSTSKKEVKPEIYYFLASGSNLISQSGETKNIKIKGTPGVIFSITIEDSSGCSILKKDIQNATIPDFGVYQFDQTFPSIHVGVGTRKVSKSRETYTIKLTPAADVVFPYNIDEEIVINQYADPVVTLTKTTSQTTPAISVSGSDITKTGTVGSKGRDIPGYSSTAYTLTITAAEGEEDSGTWYVKNDKLNFNDRISTNTVIKKKIDRCGGTGKIRTLTLDPLTTRTESAVETDGQYKIDGVVQSNATIATGDLQAGMRLYAKVEKTKTVVASLDSDNNVLDFETCKNKETHRIKLSDTNDLVEDMAVILDGRNIGKIESVVCDKTIEISSKVYITRNTSLIFRNIWRSAISSVIDNINSKGQATVGLISAVDIPHHTEIEFDDNANVVSGDIKHSGSGTDTITLNTTFNVEKFGYKDVTYTLDLDEFITRTPNAYDRRITTAKETAITINLAESDYDSNATSKTITVASPIVKPGNGEVTKASSPPRLTYTPAKGFTGEDFFTYTIRDSANTSEEKTVFITVK